MILLVGISQEAFEDFLKLRAKETIVAAQKQAELIGKWDSIFLGRIPTKEKQHNLQEMCSKWALDCIQWRMIYL